MTCSADEDREMARNEISTNIRGMLQRNIVTPCGLGWTLVAFLNMSNPSQQCPQPWTQTVSGYPPSDTRVCYRSQSTGSSCDSVMYNTSGVGYNQVCGRIIGYQFYNTWGFRAYDRFGYSINTYYVDGISVTHGKQPRMHIWTFAAAHSEIDSNDACPCGNRTNPPDIPPYVGNNYYCESAGAGYRVSNILHTDDPLWDGEGCDPGRECECTRNSPPWFMAQLPTSTTNDIEVRNCAYGSTAKNVGIELIELYVK